MKYLPCIRQFSFGYMNVRALFSAKHVSDMDTEFMIPKNQVSGIFSTHKKTNESESVSHLDTRWIHTNSGGY